MDYYLIRAWIPIITIILYYVLFHSPLIIQYSLFETLNYSSIIIIIILFTFYIFKISLKEIIKVRLTINGSIFSLFFLIIVLNYIYRITNKYDYSIFISILSILSLGWLYEIPFYHNNNMFYNSTFSIYNIYYYPLFIHSQLLSLILLILSLYKNNFKINKIIILSLFIYLIYFIYMFFNASDNGTGWFLHLYNKELSKWLIRLPSALFIISLFSGYNKK